MSNSLNRLITSFLLLATASLCTPNISSAQSPSTSDAISDSGYVLVNGARLWYEIEGTGEPLLLIAGGPGISHTYFLPYFSALADSFRIVYFDAFGRGKSDRAKSPSEYTFERDVEDIEELRIQLKLEKISVLGHSYGGLVAQAYALRFPESVNKLILANTMYNSEVWQAGTDNYNREIENQFPEAWERLQALRSQGLRSSSKEHQEAYDQVALLNLMCLYNGSVVEKLAPPELNPDVLYAIGGNDQDFVTGGSIAGLDFKNRLKDLTMPTLVLAGRYDRVCFPKYSEQFKTYAPQAQFVMFEQSGHFPFIEETDLWFDTLRAFLSR